MTRFFFKFFLICSIALTSLSLNGQNTEILDSLKMALNYAELDSTRALINLNICKEYSRVQNGEQGLSHGLKAFDYFQIEGSNEELAEVLYAIAISYGFSNNYQLCIDYNLKALKLYENIKDTTSQGNAHSQIGVAYYYLQNWEKAAEFFTNALKLASLTKNRKGQAKYMNNLGLIFEQNDDFDKALEYYSKSLIIKHEIGDSLSISRSLANMGNIYFEKEEYEKAIELYEKSISIKRNFKDYGGLSNVLQNLGYTYFRMKKYNLAIKFISEAIDIAKEGNDLARQQQAYVKLGELYESIKDYKNTLKYFQLSYLIKDSLANINKAELIAKMDGKIMIEKKDKEIALQQVEIEKQNTEVQLQSRQKIWFAIGMILALVLLVVAYRGIKIKQKANKQLQEKNIIIEEKNEQITDSINYAKRIQSAILPPDKVINEHLKEWFILYKPKDIVAGDFYWMERVEDKVLFAAADCTGHGVPGAMVSVVCNNALNRSVREHSLTDPGKILDRTREIVIQEFEKSDEDVKDGMDIALCSLEGSRLLYAGANNPLWIIRKEKLIEIKADKQPIGKFDNLQPYKTHTIDLEREDTIFIFSDGFVDQFGGEKGKKFKAKAFKDLLLSIQDQSIQDQKSIIDDAFENWRGHEEQIDDVCIIGVRV